jgi:alpha-mannosidase
VTLIRSSFEPDPLPEIGKHEVQLGLLPFAGRMSVREAVAAARRFDHAVRVVSTDAHPGNLPPAGRFASCTAKAVVLAGIKKAEDSDALVLRLYNTGAKAEEAGLRFDAALVGTVTEAVEVDLMERPLAGSAVAVAAGRMTVKVPGKGIASVLVKFHRPKSGKATPAAT